MKAILRNLFRHLTYQAFSPGTLLRETYEAFKAVLTHNKASLELMAEIEMIYHDRQKVDLGRVQQLCRRLSGEVGAMVDQLNRMSPVAYAELPAYYRKIDFYITLALATMQYDITPPYVLGIDDIPEDGEPVAGAKAWRLSLIRRNLTVPVPQGFVATASACRYLIEANNLRQRIDEVLAGLDVRNTAQLEHTADWLETLIANAEVPDQVMREIMETSRSYISANENIRFAVRSSAIGEDGTMLSFAGQHLSALNVHPESLIDAYKKVIASKYSPKALHYRISNGLIDVDIPMAVLFLPMLDADSAGVIYTSDPTAFSEETITIHAVMGLGEALVSGAASAERYDMSRESVPRCVSVEKGCQSSKAVPGPDGGIRFVPLEEGECLSQSLHPEDCTILAQWALCLESFFGGPLDIEWCRDRTQGMTILQARPLHIGKPAENPKSFQPPEGATILAEGGKRAAGGCASGPAFLLTPGRLLDDMPNGAVLVAAVASPDLSLIIDRLAGAVFEIGSPAGHFASIARERGLPAIVRAEGALTNIKDGMMVTVDADTGRVYDGAFPDLTEARILRTDSFVTSPFQQKVRRALDFISPLTLTDPSFANFVPGGCKTMHDIIRFCHERALHEMFSLGRRGSRASRKSRRLITDLPLVMYLLDISGGDLRLPIGKGSVAIDEIDHEPLHSLWKGLSHPDIHWSSDLLHIDWEKLEQVTSGGIMSLDSPLLASFAVLSNGYLNLSIRFGYHFAVVDSFCSETDEKSYVLFSFKGGGGAREGVMLRIVFLREVLSHYGFTVATRGDMVEAELTHRTASEIHKALVVLGALLGCTRLLDFSLQDEEMVRDIVRRFLAGDYRFTAQCTTHADKECPDHGHV